MPFTPEEARRYRRRQRAKRSRIALHLLAAVLQQETPACVDCGSTDQADLELDHRDPAAKRFNPRGSGYSRPWSDWIDEVLKCDLRCSSCHLVRTVREGHNVPAHRREAAAQIQAHLQRGA